MLKRSLTQQDQQDLKENEKDQTPKIALGRHDFPINYNSTQEYE